MFGGPNHESRKWESRLPYDQVTLLSEKENERTESTTVARCTTARTRPASFPVELLPRQLIPLKHRLRNRRRLQPRLHHIHNRLRRNILPSVLKQRLHPGARSQPLSRTRRLLHIKPALVPAQISRSHRERSPQRQRPP